MSEFDPAIAARYTELMAPAFVVGMSEIPESMFEVQPGWMRAYFFQPPIRDRLQQVNWCESGLPNKEWPGPTDSFKQKDLSPGAYAERLMAFASEDGCTILRLCESFVERSGLPEGVTLKDVLLNSKKTLLDVALLTDSDKQRLYDVIADPQRVHIFNIDISLPEDPLKLEKDRHEQWRFKWHENIEEFIDTNIYPDRGCPAHRFIITDKNGRKQQLLYYFWDKTVEACYDS